MVPPPHHYPLIRELSTTSERTVLGGRRARSAFHNTNTLVRSPASGWEIAVSKTGYIREAGKCLVMQAWLNNKPVVIVLLDSWGRLTRIGDANRIKRWIEKRLVVKELENGPARRPADLAVHSMKDVPMQMERSSP
jgi:D-alanyl-D-alanine endopeptidase (penicillin-binding protein 7)